MRVFVFEALSGGYPETNVFPQSSVYEGFAMLEMMTGGLNKNNEVYSLLDGSMKTLSPRLKGRVLYSDSPDPVGYMLRFMKNEGISCVIPIAPEQYLAEIIRRIRREGFECIASDIRAIEIAADKYRTYKSLKSVVPMPLTRRVGGIRTYPQVIKPKRGTSCQNISKIESEREYQEIAGNTARCRGFIAQEFIEGIDASVILFSNGTECMPVSLGRQFVSLGARSYYSGGSVPFRHPMGKKACAYAKRAVERIGGLKGAVGVDVVLTEKEAYVIEINPRPTTSMIALDKAGFNVADAYLNAYFGRLPLRFRTGKTIKFSIEYDKDIKDRTQVRER